MSLSSSSTSSSFSDDSSSVDSKEWRRSGLSRAVYKYERKMEKEQRKAMKRMEKEQKRAQKQREKEQRRAEKQALKAKRHPEKQVLKEKREYNKVEHPLASHGKVIFNSAYAMGITPTELDQMSVIGSPITPPVLRVIRGHLVDETAPEYAAHGIIGVEEGELVQLLDGSIENGLLPPYGDYVLVRASDGRIGKVGKYCFI